MTYPAPTLPLSSPSIKTLALQALLCNSSVPVVTIGVGGVVGDGSVVVGGGGGVVTVVVGGGVGGVGVAEVGPVFVAAPVQPVIPSIETRTTRTIASTPAFIFLLLNPCNGILTIYYTPKILK